MKNYIPYMKITFAVQLLYRFSNIFYYCLLDLTGLKIGHPVSGNNASIILHILLFGESG